MLNQVETPVTPAEQFANDQAWLEEMNKAMQGAGGVQLPFTALNIWATSGKKNLKQVGGVAYFGGWSADAEQFESIPELSGVADFVKVDRAGDNGDYSVYEARFINIAPIALRESWLSKDGKSRRAKYDTDHSRSHTQILCLLGLPVTNAKQQIVGIKYACPAVVSAKGIGMGGTLKSALAVWKKAIDQSRKDLNTHAKYPGAAFWQTIGTRGEAIFEEVGKSVKNTVTPIKALLPVDLEKMTAAVIDARFVGDANLRSGYDLLKQAADWLKAWNTPTVSDYEAEVEPAAEVIL